MDKKKQKLTTAQKAEKKRRREEYMTIFIRGKQKRIRRPPTIDGMDADEFILRNADPVWLHQNEMWEYLEMKLPDEPCKGGIGAGENSQRTANFKRKKAQPRS
jgi:hypothetical protein